jgi:hypothetical protein
MFGITTAGGTANAGTCPPVDTSPVTLGALLCNTSAPQSIAAIAYGFRHMQLAASTFQSCIAAYVVVTPLHEDVDLPDNGREDVPAFADTQRWKPPAGTPTAEVSAPLHAEVSQAPSVGPPPPPPAA